MRAACERRAGRIAAAERTLAETESLPKPQQGAIAALFQVVKALTAFSRGNLQLAIDEGLASQRVMDASGGVALRALHCVHNVGMLMAAGDLDRASRLAEEARDLVTGSSMDALLGTIALYQAHIAHLRGETGRCTEFLQEALRFLRRDSGKARARWYPQLMSALFPLALREGIEPGLVKSLIREFRIAPQSAEAEGWPWPIEIFTLGRFELVKDGLPLHFEHKAPRKPIAVLKVLVARGGRDVPISQLIDDLWPGAEGDAAQEACRTALHRLRNLLGDADTITLDDGRLSLDPRQVWVDALAFERAADAAVDPTRIASLYRGQFLPEEREAPWALPMRERLRNKFVRHVAQGAFGLEQCGQLAAAASLYQRGIDADDLAEEFYQGLMRCHIERGRHADAMAVYRRLRQMLLVTLGIAPSRDSDALFRRLEHG
jgi:DNA-binding SARP family transcriptional activator